MIKKPKIRKLSVANMKYVLTFLVVLFIGSCITVEKEKVVTVMQKPPAMEMCLRPSQPKMEFDVSRGTLVIDKQDAEKLFSYIIEMKESIDSCNAKIIRHNQVYSRQ
jgi:hypothetical protein